MIKINNLMPGANISVILKSKAELRKYRRIKVREVLLQTEKSRKGFLWRWHLDRDLDEEE